MYNKTKFHIHKTLNFQLLDNINTTSAATVTSTVLVTDGQCCVLSSKMYISCYNQPNQVETQTHSSSCVEC